MLPYAIYKVQEILGNMYSRSCEWQADNFAIAHTTEPEVLLKAAEALERHHLGMQTRHLMYTSHPSSQARAANIRKAAEKIISPNKKQI